MKNTPIKQSLNHPNVVRCLRAALTVTGTLALLSALSVLAFPASAFAAGAPGVTAADAEQASPTLTFATHIEEQGKVQLIAGAYLASHREGEAYLPIPFAVGIQPGGPSFTLRPESFRLFAPDGEEIKPAVFKELRRDYRRLGFDRKLLRLRPMLGGQEFLGHIGISSNFYPAVGYGVRQETADLNSNTFTADFLYFPYPKGGLEGVFTLRLQADGLGEPMDVHFVIP